MITVSSPLGENRVGMQPIAKRLASLDGVTLGILNNHKPNSLALQERVVELIGARHRLAGVVTKQKPSAAVGAEKLDVYAREVGAVVTAHRRLRVVHVVVYPRLGGAGEARDSDRHHLHDGVRDARP